MQARAIRAEEPGHWLLDREEPRRRIDARAIVEQAHALVHEGGTGALSMRSLAASLGTSTSALYRHFPSKQWLLIAIVDLVFGEVETAATGMEGRPARERLERLSASLRRVLSAHPHLHEILTSQVASTPSTVRLAEAAFACLRDLGLDGAELIDAYNAWCGYVIGFTILEAKPPGPPDRALQRAMRAQLERSAPEDLPLVSGLPPGAANAAYGLAWQPATLGARGSSFDWGLRVLLDGFDDGRRDPPPRRRRAR